jgi:hypothetical protein
VVLLTLLPSADLDEKAVIVLQWKSASAPLSLLRITFGACAVSGLRAGRGEVD